MALTATQKADVRRFLGWSARFHQFDSRLEHAMSAIDTEPEHEAQITNLIGDAPPGLLALLEDIDAKLLSSHSRLKADVVGSIKLNRREQKQLYREGRRHTGRLASILGVEVRQDVYSGVGPTTFASHGGMGGDGNYIGK
jgi:hypothetical protein